MGNNFSATEEQSWWDSCKNALLLSNTTSGLVDQNGLVMDVFNNFTAGVTLQRCYDTCGSGIMYQAFIYDDFATSFTSWLLPWLALAAQLPFQTSGPAYDILSALVAIGSPAHITYSLSITILSKSWVRSRFSRLKRASRSIRNWAPHMSERVSAAEDLLQDAVQTPIRVSQETGWLGSLILLYENQKFWKIAKADLRNTRREYSASLLAQMFMAGISYLFTIISAFNGGFTGSSIALLIASGTAWVWMIPVILGWIAVGTQCRAGSLNDALQSEHRQTYRALSTANENDELVVEDIQQGIVNRSGLNPYLSSQGNDKEELADVTDDSPGIELGSLHTVDEASDDGLEEKDDNQTTETWYGFDVAGDERQDGPINNYARIFTWSQCAFQLHRGFTAALANLGPRSSSRKRVDGKPWVAASTGTQEMRANLHGTSQQLAKYCNLSDARNLAYIPFSEMPATIWHRILISAFVAVFVQWGTTGPAVWMDYLSPPVGLGCRSMTYISYGVAATFSWLLLVSSSFFSHAAMLRHQHSNLRATLLNQSTTLPLHNTAPSAPTTASSIPSQISSTLAPTDTAPRTLGHSILCALAVLTRLLGKLIAALNAFWLVISGVLEYAGIFETCYCVSNAMGRSDPGWIAFFLEPSSFSAATVGPLAEALVLSVVVCIISMAFFWLASTATSSGGD